MSGGDVQYPMVARDDAPRSLLCEKVLILIKSVKDVIVVNPKLLGPADEKSRRDIIERAIIPRLTSIDLNVDDTLNKVHDSSLVIVESGRLVVEATHHNCDLTLETGSMYGEIGVVFGIPRIATVTCVEKSRLWILEREVFLTVIQTDELIIHHVNDVNSEEAIIRRRNRIAKSLLKLSEISSLPFDRLRRLIFQLQTASFERGRGLYTEGKCTTRIMVIDKGFVDVEVHVAKKSVDDNEAEINGMDFLKYGVMGTKASIKRMRGSFCDDGDTFNEKGKSPDTDAGINKSFAVSDLVLGRATKGRANGSSSSTNHHTNGHGVTSAAGGSTTAAAAGSGLKLSSFTQGLLAEAASLVTMVQGGNKGHKPENTDLIRKTVRFGPGTLLGVGVMASKQRAPGAWDWKDELVNGEPRVGAIYPTNIIAASRKVEVTYFTVHMYESLFGPASILNVFPSSLGARSTSPGTEVQREDVLSADTEETDTVMNGFTIDSFDNVIFTNSFAAGTFAVARKRRNELEDITGQQATIYCLKIVSKSVVSRQHSEQKFFTEAELLSTLSSPFIVRLYGRFQTVDDLVFVMENISEGGDLWGLMYENLTGFKRSRIVPGRRNPLISLDMVRFYSSCVILALAHMHKNDIIYRNMRPENILLDIRGYPRLISLSCARELPYFDITGAERTKAFTLCGNTEYMAPEMLSGLGYDKAADVWALGILMYEMLIGETPFVRYGQVNVGTHKHWIIDADKRILAKIATLVKKGKPVAVPRQFREEGAAEGGIDIMQRFLSLNAADRPQLTPGPGSKEIQTSDFFHPIDWKHLRNMSVTAPYIPPAGGVTRDEADTMTVDDVTSADTSRANTRSNSPVDGGGAASPAGSSAGVGAGEEKVDSVGAANAAAGDDYRFDDVDDKDDYQAALQHVETKVEKTLFVSSMRTRLRLRERGVRFHRVDERALQDLLGRKVGPRKIKNELPKAGFKVGIAKAVNPDPMRFRGPSKWALISNTLSATRELLNSVNKDFKSPTLGEVQKVGNGGHNSRKTSFSTGVSSPLLSRKSSQDSARIGLLTKTKTMSDVYEGGEKAAGGGLVLPPVVASPNATAAAGRRLSHTMSESAIRTRPRSLTDSELTANPQIDTAVAAAAMRVLSLDDTENHGRASPEPSVASHSVLSSVIHSTATSIAPTPRASMCLPSTPTSTSATLGIIVENDGNEVQSSRDGSQKQRSKTPPCDATAANKTAGASRSRSRTPPRESTASAAASAAGGGGGAKSRTNTPPPLLKAQSISGSSIGSHQIQHSASESKATFAPLVKKRAVSYMRQPTKAATATATGATRDSFLPSKDRPLSAISAGLVRAREAVQGSAAPSEESTVVPPPLVLPPITSPTAGTMKRAQSLSSSAMTNKVTSEQAQKSSGLLRPHTLAEIPLERQSAHDADDCSSPSNLTSAVLRSLSERSTSVDSSDSTPSSRRSSTRDAGSFTPKGLSYQYSARTAENTDIMQSSEPLTSPVPAAGSRHNNSSFKYLSPHERFRGPQIIFAKFGGLSGFMTAAEQKKLKTLTYARPDTAAVLASSPSAAVGAKNVTPKKGRVARPSSQAAASNGTKKLEDTPRFPTSARSSVSSIGSAQAAAAAAAASSSLNPNSPHHPILSAAKEVLEDTHSEGEGDVEEGDYPSEYEGQQYIGDDYIEEGDEEAAAAAEEEEEVEKEEGLEERENEAGSGGGSIGGNEGDAADAGGELVSSSTTAAEVVIIPTNYLTGDGLHLLESTSPTSAHSGELLSKKSDDTPSSTVEEEVAGEHATPPLQDLLPTLTFQQSSESENAQTSLQIIADFALSSV